MYNPSNFYWTIQGMSNKDLVIYEKETYGRLVDITRKYVYFVKHQYIESLDYIMRESQIDFLNYLLAIWDMMKKRGVDVPDRFPQKFVLTVLLIKAKKGL